MLTRHHFMTRTPIRRGTSQLRRTPLPRVSKKQARLGRALAKSLREIVRETDGLCQFRIPGVCTTWIEGTAHLRKRSQGRDDSRANIRGACNACNGWCERFPIKAHAMGLVVKSWEQL